VHIYNLLLLLLDMLLIQEMHVYYSSLFTLYDELALDKHVRPIRVKHDE